MPHKIDHLHWAGVLALRSAATPALVTTALRQRRALLVAAVLTTEGALGHTTLADRRVRCTTLLTRGLARLLGRRSARRARRLDRLRGQRARARLKRLVLRLLGLVRLVRTDNWLGRLELGRLSPRELVHEVLDGLALRVDCGGTPRRQVFALLRRWRLPLRTGAWPAQCVEWRNVIEQRSASGRGCSLLVVLWAVNPDGSLAIMRIRGFGWERVLVMVRWLGGLRYVRWRRTR